MSFSVLLFIRLMLIQFAKMILYVFLIYYIAGIQVEWRQFIFY